jgi:hypothetical protein
LPLLPHVTTNSQMNQLMMQNQAQLGQFDGPLHRVRHQRARPLMIAIQTNPGGTNAIVLAVFESNLVLHTVKFDVLKARPLCNLSCHARVHFE